MALGLNFKLMGLMKYLIHLEQISKYLTTIAPGGMEMSTGADLNKGPQSYHIPLSRAQEV